MPELSNKAFPEAKKLEKNGQHLKLYTFSPDDYQRAGEVWNGVHPEDGQPLEVVFGAPKGFPVPDLPEEPQLNAPGAEEYDQGMFQDIAKKMGIL